MNGARAELKTDMVTAWQVLSILGCCVRVYDGVEESVICPSGCGLSLPPRESLIEPSLVDP